ncbi:MAG: hypothetical protein ACQ9MH_27495 [Nitrospinales bacterium]
MSKQKSTTKALTPISLVRDIQAKKIAPESLSIEDRQGCVEYLMIEGYSAVEIAEILKKDPRTIRRDKQHLRKANSLKYELELAEQLLGQLVQTAEQCIYKLRKYSRDRDCSITDKIAVELGVWKIFKELVEKLQSVGYLPFTLQENGSGFDAISSPQDLQAKLNDLKQLAKESDTLPDTVADHITAIEAEIKVLYLEDKIDSLTSEVQENNNA